MVTIAKLKCKRCDWVWQPNVPRPAKCPHCQAKDWDKAKQAQNGKARKAGTRE